MVLRGSFAAVGFMRSKMLVMGIVKIFWFFNRKTRLYNNDASTTTGIELTTKSHGPFLDGVYISRGDSRDEGAARGKGTRDKCAPQRF